MRQPQFHTIEPTYGGNPPRNTLRSNIFPSVIPESQFKDYMLDNPLIKKRYNIAVECSTAESTGFSGSTSINLLKDGVLYVGGHPISDLVDPNITTFFDPLITAQLVVFESETPPTQSHEHYHPMPFTEINTNGTIQQAASMDIEVTYAGLPGEVDSLAVGFQWYRRSAANLSGRLLLQIWDLSARSDTPVDGYITGSSNLPSFFVPASTPADA